MDPDTLYPHVIHRPPPLPYTPGCLAHYEVPINFAKNYKDTIKHKEPFNNEEEEDLLDALAPIFDQLKLAKGWWALEMLPYKQEYQQPDNTWKHVRGYVDNLISPTSLFWLLILLAQHQCG